MGIDIKTDGFAHFCDFVTPRSSPKLFNFSLEQLKMDQFWPDLQLPKAEIKMPWATAEYDKIPKMGKIICFYVNTHVLKSEPGYFGTFSHR